MKPITDYYCSEKFNQLSIDLNRFETLNCCTAQAEKIDFNWLNQNPNQLFNTPKMHHERMQMFSNQRVESCNICWKAEEQGLTSYRQLISKSVKKTDKDLFLIPVDLNLIVGVNCNMSCVYCNKHYSSSWINDIKNNGVYLDGKYDRFKLDNYDLILNKLSQKEIEKSNLRKLLFDEIKNIVNQPECKKIVISGGEPFLYLYLSELCNLIPDDKKIIIYTGLGVNEKRFLNEITQLKNKNLEIVISGENTNRLYEFTRFGNSWKNFNNNIETIEKLNIENNFSIVVSNLTIFDLPNFIKKYPRNNNRFLFCNDPEFLNIKFLDDLSKQKLLDTLTDFPKEISLLIEQNLNQQPEKEYIVDLRNYLIDFSTRRKLSLDIFPKSFLDWLENNYK